MQDQSKKRYKYCFVPNCGSNNFSNPNKEFLNVPQKTVTRNSWCKAVGRKPDKTPLISHCCEDHFNVSVSLYFK